MQKCHTNIVISAPPPKNSGGRLTSDISASYASIQDYLPWPLLAYQRSQKMLPKSTAFTVLLTNFYFKHLQVATENVAAFSMLLFPAVKPLRKSLKLTKSPKQTQCVTAK